ncbi:MAG: hypothetical protein HYV77_01560 [Candidatus Wildermuthbacteria bacterium]|nr:hypothetical protein [Candidatus Wildermuthbacteria bacterium]
MRTKIIFGAILFFGASLAFLGLWGSDSVLNGHKTKTYSNPELGFSLEYPVSLGITEYMGGSMLIGRQDTASGTQVSVAISGQEQAQLSYGEFMAAKAIDLCSKNLSDNQASCAEIVKLETVTTAKGILGEKLYIRETSRNREIGPFFAFNISPLSGNEMRTLFLHPSAKAGKKTDPKIIHAVADTVQIRNVK